MPTESRPLPRMLVVDDQAVVRRGLAAFLCASGAVEACDTASTEQEALQAIDKRRPDLVILDLHLHQADGLSVTRNLRQQYPALPILILSLSNESTYATPSLAAGANGYIMKSDAGDHLVEAIREVLQGHTYLSDMMKDRLHHSANGG